MADRGKGEKKTGLSVPILKHGDYLIASIRVALADSEVAELKESLIGRIRVDRTCGVIVDVTALDVIDSFAARALRAIAEAATLYGAETVIVGVQPEVAAAMVQFDLDYKALHTALDLEDGFPFLNKRVKRAGSARGRNGDAYIDPAWPDPVKSRQRG